MAEFGVEPGDRVELRFELDPFYAVVAETYEQASRGELMVYEDSYGVVRDRHQRRQRERADRRRPGRRRPHRPRLRLSARRTWRMRPTAASAGTGARPVARATARRSRRHRVRGAGQAREGCLDRRPAAIHDALPPGRRARGGAGRRAARRRRPASPDPPLRPRDQAPHGLRGTGTRGASGDGGPARRARLTEPTEPVFDRAGNLYFSDVHDRPGVRRIDSKGADDDDRPGHGSGRALRSRPDRPLPRDRLDRSTVYRFAPVRGEARAPPHTPRRLARRHVRQEREPPDRRLRLRPPGRLPAERRGTDRRRATDHPDQADAGHPPPRQQEA